MQCWHKYRRALMAVGIILASCHLALALDPSLDVSQYAHTAWKISDGFTKGTIVAMAQTPDGYLWLGTDFGLLRFDGVRAVPWQPPAGEHLPSSAIRSLLVARDGTLWIGTLRGLASWKDGKLTQYPQLSGFVGELLEDHDGTVWAGAQVMSAGILCAIHSGSVQCYGDDGNFGLWVESLYEDGRGNLWVAAATGLWRWKPGPPKHYPALAPLDTFQTLMEGENGTLLIAVHGGIKQLVEEKTEAYPLPGDGRFIPHRLFRDRDGGLWIGTRGQGLLHTHRGRTDLYAPLDGLSGDDVEIFFEDREGSIWVSTADGLDRFRNFTVATIRVKQGLSNNGVWSLLAGSDGSVWLCGPDGLNRWKQGQVTIYRRQSGQAATGDTKQNQEPHGLGRQARSVCPVRRA